MPNTSTLKKKFDENVEKSTQTYIIQLIVCTLHQMVKKNFFYKLIKVLVIIEFIFGQSKSLDILENADSWYMDGTFKIAPNAVQLFNQVYVCYY